MPGPGTSAWRPDTSPPSARAICRSVMGCPVKPKKESGGRSRRYVRKLERDVVIHFLVVGAIWCRQAWGAGGCAPADDFQHRCVDATMRFMAIKVGREAHDRNA